MDDLATMFPGSRTHIDGKVRGQDRLLVMLDHDDRVAELSEPLEGADEAAIVSLMKPDRRLVEHVEHTHEP